MLRKSGDRFRLQLQRHTIGLGLMFGVSDILTVEGPC